jgi:hypothetical protein
VHLVCGDPAWSRPSCGACGTTRPGACSQAGAILLGSLGPAPPGEARRRPGPRGPWRLPHSPPCLCMSNNKCFFARSVFR